MEEEASFSPSHREREKIFFENEELGLDFSYLRKAAEKKIFGEFTSRAPKSWWTPAREREESGILPLKFEHSKCDFLDPLRRYPKVTNVVVTVKVGRTVDLSRLSMRFPNMGKDAKFPANICKIDKGTSLIFTTGALLIAGCKTYNEAKYHCHLTRMMIESVEQPVLLVGKKSGRKRLRLGTLRNGLTSFENFRVVNIVSNGRPVKSVSLARMGAANCNLNWNPSYFPGLEQVLTNEEVPFQSSDSVSVTLFGSGRGVSMGARTMSDTYTAYGYIAEKASNFPEGSCSSSYQNRTVRSDGDTRTNGRNKTGDRKKSGETSNRKRNVKSKTDQPVPCKESIHDDSDIDDILECFDVL